MKKLIKDNLLQDRKKGAGSMNEIIPLNTIENEILFIRGQKVMLSAHLAELYGVETRVLNQAVRRNIKRFPEDFMFQLKESETEKLVSQNVIPHKKYFGGSCPYAFTEQGIAMLSGVLNSDRAVSVNIEIMRAFIRLWKMLVSNVALARKIKSLENKYDEHFKIVFEAIYKLMEPKEKKRRKIGFKREK